MQNSFIRLLSETENNFEKKVLILLYEHKTLTETYFVNEYKISAKKFVSNLDRLIKQKIIQRRRKDLDIIYYISKSCIKANENCDGCKYKTNTKCNEIDTIGCKIGELKIDCAHDWNRILHNTARVLDKNTIEINTHKIERSKSDKKIVRATEDWKMIDFYKYYCEEMKSKWGNVILEDYNKSYTNLETIKNQFKEINPQKWRMLMKFYIHWMIRINNCKTIFGLTNIANLRLYMSEKGLSVLKVKLCSFHDIFCPHFINQKCVFSGGEKSCTPTLREVYKHYN